MLAFETVSYFLGHHVCASLHRYVRSTKVNASKRCDVTNSEINLH